MCNNVANAIVVLKNVQLLVRISIMTQKKSDPLYATTCAAAQAESRCVWVCSAISRFSPGFHDFPKFLPGGPKGGGGPDGQLFPHKLPTACPNLSLGSVAAAERGSGHVRKCSPCFLAFTPASSSSKIHITPLTSFSPPPWLAAPLALMPSILPPPNLH